MGRLLPACGPAPFGMACCSLMDQPKSKYVSFAVTGTGERWSELMGRMVPCFDTVTMLRTDYERLLASGGEKAVLDWVLAKRGAAVN